MKIQRTGSTPSRKGLPENFTGAVRIDSLFQAEPPGRAGGAIVTFEPRRSHALAYASARSDLDRDIGRRLDSMRGGANRRNPGR